MDEQYKPEEIMSTPQKETNTMRENHLASLEKMGKSGSVCVEKKYDIDTAGHETIMKGIINGHSFEIKFVEPKSMNPYTVGKVDGNDVTPETAKKIFDKYIGSAYDLAKETTLMEQHKKEATFEEVIDDILK